MHRRPGSSVAAALVAGLAVVAGVTACSDRSGASDGDVDARVAAADPAAGAAVFAELCAACHGPEGEGGIGADLRGLGGRLTPAEVHHVVTDGRGRMPAWGGSLDQADIDAVVAYLVQTFPG